MFKHVLLARIVEHQKTKNSFFRIFGTHSGIGSYNLAFEEAQKTEEWQQGMQKMMEAEIPGLVKNCPALGSRAIMLLPKHSAVIALEKLIFQSALKRQKSEID